MQGDFAEGGRQRVTTYSREYPPGWPTFRPRRVRAGQAGPEPRSLRFRCARLTWGFWICSWFALEKTSTLDGGRAKLSSNGIDCLIQCGLAFPPAILEQLALYGLIAGQLRRSHPEKPHGEHVRGK